MSWPPPCSGAHSWQYSSTVACRGGGDAVAYFLSHLGTVVACDLSRTGSCLRTTRTPSMWWHAAVLPYAVVLSEFLYRVLCQL